MDSKSWASLPVGAGESYEDFLVPTIFDGWADLVLDRLDVRGGDHLLDVACGTGVVARKTKEIVGPTGRVVGVDLSESMLDVARRLESRVEWLRADAANLPFQSGSFDVVVCQAGLMFFPDRAAAVIEMTRVLREGGRILILVFGDPAGQREFAGVVRDHVGGESADRYLTPWSMADREALRELLEDSDLRDVTVTTATRMVQYQSVEHFMRGSAAVLLADVEDIGSLRRDAEGALARYTTESGSVEVPMEAIIGMGCKAD